MSVWLNYYEAHMQLTRDLGVMQLDADGLWVQQPLENFERCWPDDDLLPPEIPAQWFKDLDGAGTKGHEAGDSQNSMPSSAPPPAPSAALNGSQNPNGDVERQSTKVSEKPRALPLLGRRPRSLNAKTVSDAKAISPAVPR
jgi:hypothetical protein